MKNSADQGGCNPRRPKAEVEAEGRGCSYPMKAKFNNYFITHSKYFPILKGVLPFCSFFLFTKNNTISSPGFLGQRFNNPQRAVFLPGEVL